MIYGRISGKNGCLELEELLVYDTYIASVVVSASSWVIDHSRSQFVDY